MSLAAFGSLRDRKYNPPSVAQLSKRIRAEIKRIQSDK
jgi:hypothetical protein